MFKTIEWTDEGIRLLDQVKLPNVEEYQVLKTYQEVSEAIKSMVVRGAPAIGVAAAMGVALGMRDAEDNNIAELREHFKEIKEVLCNARPTANNLSWAVRRMETVFEAMAAETATKGSIAQRLITEALAIQDEDLKGNIRIGHHGQQLLPNPANVLTHCNAGALATAGYGTALGVIRAVAAAGRGLKVFVDETRPLLQGARLTAWELSIDQIDVTVTLDSAIGTLMQQQKVNVVIVGADRVAANGDVVNKIGTYHLAVLANYHGIPFYVAAPFSTLDLEKPDGSYIPIEERAGREITHFGEMQVVPDSVGVFNPAFDVTPNKLVTAIITDRGVALPPYLTSLAKLGRSPNSAETCTQRG